MNKGLRIKERSSRSMDELLGEGRFATRDRISKEVEAQCTREERNYFKAVDKYFVDRKRHND